MTPGGAPYAPSETHLPKRIGPYRIVRLIARGTTSDILLAREEGPLGFERVVALKVALPQLREDENHARLFLREASAYARLAHPAVGKLYQLLEEDGQLALVLEYIEGLSLDTLREELHRGGDRLSDEACIFIAFRLFSALAAAHGAEDPVRGDFSPVIHCDVNPSNLMVPWDGYVKLVDFGSARVAGVGAGLPDALRPRSYMAPEQARGHDVTVRTDVYSACVVLWELLTGRRALAFDGPNHEALSAWAPPSLPPLAVLRPDLPKAVHDLVARGLQSDPARRDVMAEEAREVLRSVTDADRARSGLAEGLAGLRFASIEDSRLATTPKLPAYGGPDEASPSPPPVRFRSDRPVVLAEPLGLAPSRLAWALGSGAALVIALGGSVGLYLRHGHTSSGAKAVTGAAPIPASAVALPEAPAFATSLPPAPAPPPGALRDRATAVERSPDQATLTVPPSRAGHRVWIDGRLVGQSPATFAVSCGSHEVRVGSHGSPETVTVRCGTDRIVR